MREPKGYESRKQFHGRKALNRGAATIREFTPKPADECTEYAQQLGPALSECPAAALRSGASRTGT